MKKLKSKKPIRVIRPSVIIASGVAVIGLLGLLKFSAIENEQKNIINEFKNNNLAYNEIVEYAKGNYNVEDVPVKYLNDVVEYTKSNNEDKITYNLFKKYGDDSSVEKYDKLDNKGCLCIVGGTVGIGFGFGAVITEVTSQDIGLFVDIPRKKKEEDEMEMEA